MTKIEAYKILRNDFLNNLIAYGFRTVDEIDNDHDREIAKALKITNKQLTNAH